MGGVLFALVITRRGLQGLWFGTVEWWIFPTMKFWALAGAIFFMSFAASYAFASSRGWLEMATPHYRVLAAAVLGGVIPCFLGFLSRPSAAVIGFFVSPLVIAFLLSIALFLLTSKWYKSGTVLIVIVYFAAPLVADIPDLFFSREYTWSDTVTFFIRFSLLTALCGWWLVRATGSQTPRAANQA
jgi:hypothetical protein